MIDDLNWETFEVRRRHKRFGIVRPVKRVWAVLSKDTPMDISYKNR